MSRCNQLLMYLVTPSLMLYILLIQKQLFESKLTREAQNLILYTKFTQLWVVTLISRFKLLLDQDPLIGPNGPINPQRDYFRLKKPHLGPSWTHIH